MPNNLLSPRSIYAHVHFTESGEMIERHPSYVCQTNNCPSIIGHVEWCKQLGRYIFQSFDQLLCTLDVIEPVCELMKELEREEGQFHSTIVCIHPDDIENS